MQAETCEDGLWARLGQAARPDLDMEMYLDIMQAWRVLADTACRAHFGGVRKQSNGQW